MCVFTFAHPSDGSDMIETMRLPHSLWIYRVLFIYTSVDRRREVG